MLVKVEKERGFRNSGIDVFCTECWVCIHTKCRLFTSYYQQIQMQGKPILYGHIHKWNVNRNGCWMSCGWMKSTEKTTFRASIFCSSIVVFTSVSFSLGPFFFEEPCPVFGIKTFTVICSKVYYAFVWPRGTCFLSSSPFKTSLVLTPHHIEFKVKAFLLESFTEDREISHRSNAHYGHQAWPLHIFGCRDTCLMCLNHFGGSEKCHSTDHRRYHFLSFCIC